jgi:phosphoglycerate dehydrogenase-like enzyme
MKDPIHILSTMPFPEAWLDRVRALSPRLMVKQHPASEAEAMPRELWEWAEVLYTGLVPPDPARTPRLRWVQLDTSGVDHVLRSPIWRSDIAITTLNGVAPTNMAEFVLMMMLGFAHHMRRMYDHQLLADWPTPAERWRRFMPLELRGATVGLASSATAASARRSAAWRARLGCACWACAAAVHEVRPTSSRACQRQPNPTSSTRPSG